MFQKAWNFLFANKSAMWTAIFTGVLTLFTIKLYQVSKLATDTTRSSQRAVVTFAGLGIGHRINDPQGKWVSQELYVNWANSSDTVAKAVAFKVAQKPELEEFPKGYNFPLPGEKMEGVIGAKGGQFLFTLTIPMTQLEDAWRGRSRLFIYGNAVYKDVFPDDPERLSEFCVQATHLVASFTTAPVPIKGKPAPGPVLGEPNTSLTGIAWQPCALGIHLCYDEDCEDYTQAVSDLRK